MNTPDLFSETPVAPIIRQKARRTFFPYIEAARRKLGVGKAWQWCRLEAVDKTLGGKRDTIVTGGVPNGGGSWKGVPLARVVVTDAEIAFEISDYERRTKKCAECSGFGDRSVGWNAKAGHRYALCSKCKGSGRAELSTDATKPKAPL